MTGPIQLEARTTQIGRGRLLAMTAVIHVFVHPDVYPTYGVWAAVLLLLVARGAGI